MNITKTALLLAGMTALFMLLGSVVGGQAGALIALVMAAIMNLISYWRADKIVLSMYSAREIDEAAAPDLFRLTQELAQRGDLPMPKLYVIDNPQPNAFATGRNPQNAAVAVNTGLLQLLNQDEIAGVIAHELAHIKHRDTLTMTVTATLAGAISTLANMGMWFGGRDQRAGFLGTLAMVILVPLAAMLVQMAISRTREYAADREGALISGKPLALASALQKIAGGAAQIPNWQAEQSPATAHMFIINPLSGLRMDHLFSTHPNVKNRIAALVEMAQGQPQVIQDQGRPKGPWG